MATKVVKKLFERSDSSSQEGLREVRSGMRSVMYGIIANVFLVIVKGGAGILGNSYALIADAVESALDILSALVVWAGLRYSVIPPDKNHPYGHGKAEPLATVVVSITLFAAALGISIQSIREIVTPHHAPEPFTLAILVLVVILKEILFRNINAVGKASNSTALQSDALHHRSDALTSIAAFLGISIALIGGEGYESADDWAALCASAIIVYNAYKILRPALYELSDALPDIDIENRIRKVAQNVDGVVGTHKCYVRKMGLKYHVDLDVIVDGSISVRSGHEIAHRVQDTIRTSDSVFIKVFIHIEPGDK